MNKSNLLFKCCRLGVFMLVGCLPFAGVSAQPANMETLFESLREEGGNAEDVIRGLLDSEFELGEVAAFSVANAGSIGLSVAYAQAAVCVAPDQPAAQSVGQIASDSATPPARNAVQAGVVSALSSYESGECSQLLDQINNASQAFAAPAGPAAAAPPAGGGAPPEVDSEEPPASESQ